jgi:hypothetical protein
VLSFVLHLLRKSRSTVSSLAITAVSVTPALAGAMPANETGGAWRRNPGGAYQGPERPDRLGSMQYYTRRNSVVVEAGDVGGQMSAVFTGTIAQA